MSSVSPAPAQPRTPTRSKQSRKTDENSPVDGGGPRDDVLNSIASLKPSPITLTLYVPTTAVGAVIGRRGQNIAQLQKVAASAAAQPHTPVRISVVGQPHDSSDIPSTYSELDWSDPQWTPVVIRADPCAALTAAARISEVVPQLDEVVMDIPLPRARHAAIVGKRGLTLAALSADHKVRIMVPNKDLRHDVIQLEGSLPRVKTCYFAVLRVAKGKEDGTILVPQLPPRLKLHQVGRKTDTVIRKKKLDDATWQLTVTGTGQIQAAIALLQKWKDDLGDTSAPPPQRRKGRNNKGAPKRKGST